MKLNNYSKRLSSLMIYLFIAISLFSCGDKDETTPSVPPKPTPEDSTYVNPDDNKTADITFAAYNSAFLTTDGQTQYFKESLNKEEKDYFWCQALDIQMVQDVYLRTKKSADAILITNLLNTFIAQNVGTKPPGEWGWNDFNDDILWAGLAFARGYQTTNNSLFLEKTKYAFNLMYDRGWDATLGGGIWWRQEPINEGERAKSALSNSPAVILACYLYEFTGDMAYLTKAIAIMDWELAVLYDSVDGGVYENILATGVKQGKGNVYTNGAFVGAAAHLHRLTGIEKYYDAAKKASEYVMSNRTTNGIIAKNWRSGTWQSEYARGLGEFVRDNNIWSPYYEFMKKNATAAWGCRRTDLSLMWNDWLNQMSVDNTATAMECIGGVIMQQIVPKTSPELKNGTLYRIRTKSDMTKCINVASSNNPSLSIAEKNLDGNQQFKLVYKGYGYYQLESSLIPGNVLTANGTDVVLAKALENNKNQYWKLVYDYQGFHKLKPKNVPLMCLIASGEKCSLAKESNTDRERWRFK